jgi:hypothetical protein
MFGLFKDSLDEREESDIVVLLFSGAMQYFLETIEEEGKQAGVVEDREDFSEEFWFGASELFLGYFFGRIIARSESTLQDIPKPPDLLRGKDKVKSAVCALTAPRDGTKIKVKDVDSLSYKAIMASSFMLGETEGMINFSAERNFEKSLIDEGFPDSNASRVKKKFISNVDVIIEDICEEAKDVWQEISSSNEEEAVEQYSRMARSMVSKINSRKSYDHMFQAV